MTALAVTEPEVRARTPPPDHPGQPGSTAAYRLNGQKAWISNGDVAQFYVIFATVDPTRARGG